MLVMIVPLAYAEIEITEIKTENERVHITMIGEPNTQIFINVLDDSGELAYESYRNPGQTFL